MSEQQDLKQKRRQYVCFKLDREEFGVDILKVREIIRYQEIARVPQTPKAVQGVINLRGNVIPVIDLRVKLGLPVKPPDDKTRIVVFIIGTRMIGMMVDRVERILRIAPDQIEPAPDIGAGRIQEFVQGMGKTDEDLFIILHIDKVLTEEEIIQLDELREAKNVASGLARKKRSGRSKKTSGQSQ